MNLSDGSVIWRARVSENAGILAGSVFTGKLVYAVSKDGYLAVIDANDGTVLERHLLNAEGRPGEKGLTLSSPMVTGGRVFVGSETGGMRCFSGSSVID